MYFLFEIYKKWVFNEEEILYNLWIAYTKIRTQIEFQLHTN